MNLKNPLVSIRVITYNSALYVLETLESVKNQTYENIELIVSDDCSTDNTVAVCEEWINNNRERFARTEILTVYRNTGIPGNSNRSIKASKGEWLKGIAGDDALEPDCIEQNLHFVANNPDALVVHSTMTYYNEVFNSENILKVRNLSNFKITIPTISAKEQFKLLLYGCTVNTPSLFVHRSIFDRYGLFDEEIKSIEDWPFYLKITNAGCKIYYFNYPTILYRVRSSSLCNERDNNALFNQHYLREKPIYYRYIKSNTNIIHQLFIEYKYCMLSLIDKMGTNKNIGLYKFAFRIIMFPNYIFDIFTKRKRIFHA